MRERYLFDDLAASAHPCRATAQAERHVGSDLGGDLEHAVVVDIDIDEPAHREQCSRRIRATATEPGTRGNLLPQHEAHTVARSSRAHEQLLGRDEGEVGVVCGYVFGGVVADHFHADTAGRGNRVRLDHIVRLAE